MEQQLIPNYKIEGDESTVIFDTSYVSNPATQKGFIKFSENEVKQVDTKFSIQERWERMTAGVWFMPDTKYLRVDEKGNYYTVEISKEALKDALLNFLKRGYGNNGSIEHAEYFEPNYFIGIEHWIIQDENTLSPVFGLSLTDLGYNPSEIPVGTVMRTTHVSDEAFWNEQVLTGNVTGYSIEGLFSLRLDLGQSFTETVHEKVSEEIKEEAKQVVNGTIETEDATYTIADGYVVDVDKDPKQEEESFSTTKLEVEVTEEDEDKNMPESEGENMLNQTDDIEQENMLESPQSEDTTSNDTPENMLESDDEENMLSKVTNRLKELEDLVAKIQEENLAKQEELVEKEKQLSEYRKALNNQPIKSNFTTATPKHVGSEFKIGGKTFYV